MCDFWGLLFWGGGWLNVLAIFGEALGKKAEEAAKKGDMTAEDGEKMMKEAVDMGKKVMKCVTQCMICENFPDSLSGASTILMGATVAFAGAALF